jgi:hypothetical protein
VLVLDDVALDFHLEDLRPGAFSILARQKAVHASHVQSAGLPSFEVSTQSPGWSPSGSGQR